MTSGGAVGRVGSGRSGGSEWTPALGAEYVHALLRTGPAQSAQACLLAMPNINPRAVRGRVQAVLSYQPLSRIVPAMPPQIGSQEALALLWKHHPSIKIENVMVIGIRGYYQKSMGNPTRNDFGIYDDAIVIVTPGRQAITFNANTDPSRYGRRTDGRGMAMLKPGVYRYKPGWHGYGRPTGHKAFRQSSPVTVVRYGGKEETGWFAINIHRGGRTRTSSEGCQTLPPPITPSEQKAKYGQFDSFRDKLNGLLAWYDMETFPYILLEKKA